MLESLFTIGIIALCLIFLGLTQIVLPILAFLFGFIAFILWIVAVVYLAIKFKNRKEEY